METNGLKSINSDTKKIVSMFYSEMNKFATFSEKLQIYRQGTIKFIEELNSECSKLQNEHQKSNSTNTELQNVLHEEKCNFNKYMLTLNSFEIKHEKLCNTCSETTAEYVTTGKQSTLSNSDENIINTARKTCQLYNKITRILWDYSVPKSAVVVGYVKNKQKKYLHLFEYSHDDLIGLKLVENLWNEIEHGSAEIWLDVIEQTEKDKENKNINANGGI